MNTVGWGGGALGPLFVGIASKYGSKPTEMQNMSDAIAWCGAIYIIGSGLMLAAMYFLRIPSTIVSMIRLPSEIVSMIRIIIMILVVRIVERKREREVGIRIQVVIGVIV